MKMKLNSDDVLEISKALKSGWLDLDKVKRFKALVENYNPPKEIEQIQIDYYKDCLFAGLGYVPTGEADFNALFDKVLDKLEDWEKDKIQSGELYKRLLRYAFDGMVAIRALGGVCYEKDEDFSFMEQIPEFEI